MKVLVAEDDDHIREGLVEILRNEGYAAIAARDGRAALRLYESEKPDFLCLDIMMPGLDGYEVCRRIRKDDPRTPIIFISAKSEEIDKVLGLELGADDFIVKPFGVKEVVARIRAVTRRAILAKGPAGQTEPFTIGDLIVAPDELRARRGDQVIDLSLRDVQLLAFFAAQPGKALHRNAILNACWGEDYFPNSRALDQHISQLRKRIEQDPKNPRIIRTVHGAGYRYDPEAQ